MSDAIIDDFIADGFHFYLGASILVLLSVALAWQWDFSMYHTSSWIRGISVCGQKKQDNTVPADSHVLATTSMVVWQSERPTCADSDMEIKTSGSGEKLSSIWCYLFTPLLPVPVIL